MLPADQVPVARSPGLTHIARPPHSRPSPLAELVRNDRTAADGHPLTVVGTGQDVLRER
ncbi:hypothetical protein [Streptomyces cacaoi]|uniref:hypothetical protein n=1 Tax=Streptomyces cacaoi TaxID=1898 RepID=UPI00262CD018|nr:hypothetical protein [Streptomyces cacaoi]